MGNDLEGQSGKVPMLEISCEGGIRVARTTVKKLVSANAAQFQAEFSQFVDEKDDHVLLDLASILFMDSSGLAAIVFCFKLTAIGDALAICSLSEWVAHLFRMTALDHTVRLFPDRAAAIVALNASQNRNIP